tara:strand:+ start:1090 stop:2208 length:1119 start_codon:yes stop_codon:yes gene_type:complete
MPYIGVSPFNGVRKKHTYTATASQTSFSGVGAEGITLSYKDSTFVDVFQNGVKLGEADYTSTSGTAIVLAQGASLNDLIEVVVYDVFSVADTVSKADGGTFDGNVTMGGTLAVTSTTALTGNATMAGTLNVTGETTLATHLNLGDGDIIKLGASADLQIQHDGSDSKITDGGTGNLVLDSDGTEVRIMNGAEFMGRFQNNDAVKLFFDNSKKFETTSAGATVTGYLHQTAPVVSIMSHTSQITVPDNSVTVIPFQTSDVDTHSLYDATNDRLLITSAFNGHYFQITWAVAVTGGTNGDNMFGSLRKNGSVIQNDNVFLTGDEGEQITFQGTWIGTVATNDYFDCTAFSDQSSGTKNSLPGSANSFLTAIKIF